MVLIRILVTSIKSLFEKITRKKINNIFPGLSKHLFQFKFDAVRSFLDRDRKDEDVNEFVSAVCWKVRSYHRKERNILNE